MLKAQAWLNSLCWTWPPEHVPGPIWRIWFVGVWYLSKRGEDPWEIGWNRD